MGSVYKRGRTWWLKYKDATGEWTPEATKALTKAEAKGLLHEIERRVERQRLGLEPLSVNPEGWTVADLMQWWLETYSRHSPSHEKNLGTVRRQILAAKPLEHVQSGDVEQLLQAMERDLSAATINHVRQFLVGAFNRAREAGKWLGANPAESVRTRRGTEVGDILRPEELAPFVECALRATEGPWLFPDEGGAMRNKTWQPEDILRRALKRACIVTGYTHVCRRRTCRYNEERNNAEIRPCPRCGFKLWPKRNVSARGSSRCRSSSGTPTRRSPSGGTGICCRTS